MDSFELPDDLSDYIKKHDFEGFVELFKRCKIKKCLSEHCHQKNIIRVLLEYHEDNYQFSYSTTISQLVYECEIHNNDAIAMYLISLFDFDETMYYQSDSEYTKKIYNKIKMI